MAFVVPTSGAIEFDSACVNAMVVANASAYLYVNNLTPQKTHDYTHFTAASDIEGIHVSNLYGGCVGSNGTASCVADSVTFTMTAATAQTIYGWYVTDNSSLFFAEIFTAPIIVALSGDMVELIQHTFRLYSA